MRKFDFERDKFYFQFYYTTISTLKKNHEKLKERSRAHWKRNGRRSEHSRALNRVIRKNSSWETYDILTPTERTGYLHRLPLSTV